MLELGALMALSPVARLHRRGDRHPVLVLPGFTASDTSTVPLRWHINGWGFSAHAWGLGRNLGPTPELLAGLADRLDELYSRSGQRVSLVGWSLGGIYARFLARERPAAVRQVLTMGSPYRMVAGDRSAASPLADALRPSFDQRMTDARRVPEEHKARLSVPATSIYSRSDEVVDWRFCIDSVGPLRDNVEVRASHIALGFNPGVLYVVADRLSQPEGQWRPFRAPRVLSALYPPAAEWTPQGIRQPGS